MNRSRHLPACVFVIVFFSSMGVGTKPWSVEDFAFVPSIDVLAISSDGSNLLYGIRTFDFSRNQEIYSYKLLDLESGHSQALSYTGKLWNVRWSPNGTGVAALSAQNRGTSITLISKDGLTHRIFTSNELIDSFEWSHDGGRIAFVAHQDPEPRKDLGIVLGADADLWAGRLRGRRNLYVLMLHDGYGIQMPNAGYSYGGEAQAADPQWSPDDQELMLFRQPTPQYEDITQQQYVFVDLQTKRVRAAGKGFYAYPSSPAASFSRSGEIAQVHTWDGTAAAREDIFVNGRDVTAANDMDFWSCGDSTYAWGNHKLIATALQGVSLRLFSINPDHLGPAKTISQDDGSVTIFSVSQSGRVAYAYETPSQTVQIFVENEDGTGRRRVTSIASPPNRLALARTRTISWQSGGHLLTGQLALPPEGNRFPLLVELHGGPQCADNLSFSAAAEYFATNGYAFFRPNPRGSDGYGDWSYKSIINDWAYGPSEDVLKGVEAVESLASIDTSRMYVEGSSYGGYLTSWLATHDSPFRAAVAGVPVEDLAFQSALSRSPGITERFFGPEPLRANAERLRDQSPLTHAADLRIPLLILSDLDDNQAPYPQAIMFYKTALQNHKEVQLVGYPGLGHGFGDPLNFVDWYHRIAKWFAGHGGLTFASDRAGWF